MAWLGVAVDTIDDMLALFGRIELDRTSVSMTINAPAIISNGVLSRGGSRAWIRLACAAGTFQNEILKEFHA